MKKLVALVALSLITGGVAAPTARAQQQQGQRRGRGGFQQGLNLLRLPAPLAAKLNLTSDQKSKLESIQMSVLTQAQQIQQDAGGDQQAARAKFMELQQKATADALAVLTDDQKKMFSGWQAQTMEYPGLGRAAIGLISVEGLTDDQKGKLKSLSTETQGKMQSIRQAAQGAQDRQAAFQQIQALQMETETAVRKVLTADQVKQFEAGLPQGFGRRRPAANQ